MRQIYSNAYSIILKRIKYCGLALQNVQDEYSIQYWTRELVTANSTRLKLERRFTPNNVIAVDFKSKKRIAA